MDKRQLIHRYGLCMAKIATTPLTPWFLRDKVFLGAAHQMHALRVGAGSRVRMSSGIFNQ